MKAHELIDLLEGVDPDLEITIDLTGPNLSPASTVPVEAAVEGFDWQHGQLVLVPSRPVDYRREKCRHCHIPDNDDYRTEMFCSDFENHEYTFVCRFRGKKVFSRKCRTELIDGKFKFVEAARLEAKDHDHRENRRREQNRITGEPTHGT